MIPKRSRFGLDRFATNTSTMADFASRLTSLTRSAVMGSPVTTLIAARRSSVIPIRDVADAWGVCDEIGFSQQGVLVEQARRMKTRGSLSDVHILTKLVQAADADGTVADDFER